MFKILTRDNVDSIIDSLDGKDMLCYLSNHYNTLIRCGGNSLKVDRHFKSREFKDKNSFVECVIKLENPRKFKLPLYGSENTCMFCPTLEAAERFCSLLHENYKMWVDDIPYVKQDTQINTKWDKFKENTVYYFNEDMYGSLDFAKKSNSVVLRYTDFDWE